MAQPQPCFHNSPPPLVAPAGAGGAARAWGPTVSKSLLSLVERNAANLLKKSSSYGPDASSLDGLQAFITSVEAFFGNLQDSGWNDWFTQQVAAQESVILKADLSAFITPIVQRFAGQGISLTNTQTQQLNDAFNSAIASLQTTLQQIISTGVASVEKQFVAEITSANTDVQAQYRSTLNPDLCGYWTEWSILALDGIAIGAWALGQPEVGVPFGVAGFIWGAWRAGLCK